MKDIFEEDYEDNGKKKKSRGKDKYRRRRRRRRCCWLLCCCLCLLLLLLLAWGLWMLLKKDDDDPPPIIEEVDDAPLDDDFTVTSPYQGITTTPMDDFESGDCYFGDNTFPHTLQQCDCFETIDIVPNDTIALYNRFVKISDSGVLQQYLYRAHELV
jgi:hypothetical protein